MAKTINTKTETVKKDTIDIQELLSLVSSMKEENAKILSDMKAENDKLKQEIADLKKEQEVTKETERLEEDSHSSNSVTTENLLAKLVNRKSDREVTIVHAVEMFGGMSTYIKLSTMTINFTRLGEERTLSWQQFEELCNTYRKFIDRGLIKVTPADRDLCNTYQIGCYENGSPKTLTPVTLAALPDMSEKELEACYNALDETDKNILLNYWLGQCYARPESRDRRFYNRYKIELLNHLSNSAIFDNILADMNFEEARR